MANHKPIRRALVISASSVLLCASMLIGTTFAWFTDTASTSVNTIQAGTLDIQMIDSNGNSLEGSTLSWQKAAGHENEPILWEPGCTYNIQPITIKNNGNLALKYRVEITGINGSAKLNKAIEWSLQLNDDNNSRSGGKQVEFWYHLLPGESQTLTISGHMRENAGNEYQGLTIDNISIGVYAAQDTVEYDSITDQYDAEANNVGIVDVYTYEQFVEALKHSGTIRLMNNIEVKQTVTVPTGSRIDLDMNGKTLFLADGASTETCDPMIYMKTDSALTFDGNGKVDLGANPGISFIFPAGDLTINNGTYSIDTGLNNYGAFFAGVTNGTGKLIINGGYFDGGFYDAGNCGANALHLLNLSANQYVRVYGGTFVAQNPAWGDEANGGCACALHGTNRHPGWWIGDQGVFLEGQVWTDGRTDSDLPTGYTITEGSTTDGRPTYTVNYTKP